jgi:galactokinase
MAGVVPIVSSLAGIYTSNALEPQVKRWERLLQIFKSTYGHPATFVSRSPGRVNIIGEHIDYSLYSVLPMAISADCLLAVSFSLESSSLDSFQLRLANVQAEKFAPHDFEIPNTEVKIDSKVHEWTNYFKCGLKGALEILRKNHGADFRPKSLNVLMDGSVPSGGGLSSSAAFVTASALAVMVANGEKEVDKTTLTELAIVSERNVGVNSGG